MGAFFLSCCQLSNNNNSKQVSAIQEKPDGHWILADYLDSIFKDRTIAQHRLYPIAWVAMNFSILGDSIYYSGIIAPEIQGAILGRNDTLAILNIYGSNVVFWRDPNLDLIHAIDKESRYPNKVYTYRRVKEKHLLEIIKRSKYPKFKGFNQLFVDSLIAGKYKPLDAGMGPLILDNKGTMKGFLQFNTFRIHDYFGTSHPPDGYDAIYFEDSNHRNEFPIPAGSPVKMHNWKFSGDTLTLTEMLGEGGMIYTLGTKRYRYIKRSK